MATCVTPQQKPWSRTASEHHDAFPHAGHARPFAQPRPCRARGICMRWNNVCDVMQQACTQDVAAPPCSAPDVVGVRLKLLDLVHGVVVEHAHIHVVRAAHHPLLARHKLGCPHCAQPPGSHQHSCLRLQVVHVPNMARLTNHSRELGEAGLVILCGNTEHHSSSQEWRGMVCIYNSHAAVLCGFTKH